MNVVFRYVLYFTIECVVVKVVVVVAVFFRSKECGNIISLLYVYQWNIMLVQCLRAGACICVCGLGKRSNNSRRFKEFLPSLISFSY